jgi:hypothetical protein
MDAMKVQLTEPVHLELRAAGGVIVRDFEPGVVTAKTEDDRVALEHLLALGIAKPAARTKPAAERSDS